jgi:large conductance mechanosensitive channel
MSLGYIRVGMHMTDQQQNEMLEEMRKIRELLTPKPAPVGRKGFVGEFIDFVGKYKVLGLAVAFVLGMYLGEVVKGLVVGLLMPAINMILKPRMSGDSLVGAFDPFRPGLFVTALITFVIVCLFIFVTMKVAKKWNIE